MKWRDCKTDPPKKEGEYLVYVQDYDYDFGSHYRKGVKKLNDSI